MALSRVSSSLISRSLIPSVASRIMATRSYTRTSTSTSAADRWEKHMQDDDTQGPPKSKYVGVYWNEHTSAWQARLLDVNVLTSQNELDCARAHDRAVMALRRIGELCATPTNVTKGLLAEERYSDQELDTVVDWWQNSKTLGRSADCVEAVN